MFLLLFACSINKMLEFFCTLKSDPFKSDNRDLSIQGAGRLVKTRKIGVLESKSGNIPVLTHHFLLVIKLPKETGE